MPYKDPIKNKEYQKEYQKKWREKEPQKIFEIQKRYDEKRRSTDERIIQLKDVRARRHHRFKVYVLEKYGNKCNYCGIEKYEVLCVDHIKDDGAIHRKTTKYKRLSLGGMWGYLAKTEFAPEKYQILCYNCNMIKQHYKIIPGGNTSKTFEWWKEFSKLKRNKNE